MRCPIMIGREGPVSLIAAAVRRLRADARGGALIVLGEAGIGKTRLAEHIGAAAAKAGIAAIAGRALPDVASGPLRPVAEILLELTRDRLVPEDESLAPYAAVAASLVPHWRAPDWSDPGEPVVVMAEAVLRILRWATSGAGAVVIVEDLHWADAATLATVRYLIDHADEVPVLVFGTVRSGEGREDVPSLLAAGGAQICQLGRLTAEQAHAMALACAGPGAPPDDSIATVVRAAEGLPLLVEDLLATGDLGGFPPRFAGTVRARLARLDDRHRAVVGAAAVLGRRFDWRLLDRAAGVDGREVTEALHRCTALQLVTADGAGFAFRHALTREVVLGELAVPDRFRFSLAAAEALTAAGEHSEDQMLLIGRLLAAGGEPRRAVETLLEAARRAFGAGSLSSAELFLDQAGSAAGRDDDLQARIACLRAQVLLQAGRPADAAGIAAQMVSLTDGRDAAAAAAMRMVLIRAAVMTGEWEDARIQVAAARRAAAADHQARAELDVIGAQVALGDARPGSRSQAEELAARAAATARAAGRPDLTCEALEVLGLAARLRDLDVAHDALARALDVAATASLRVHRLRILNELGTVEMLRDARGDRLEQARREAARSGAVGLAAGIGANIAALMAMTARFDATLAVAAEVEQTAVRLGLIPLQAAALLMQGFALAHQGRSRDMERYLAAAEAAAPDDPDLRAGAPVAVIETTGVRVMRLAEVDLDHAVGEGEGFTSVAEWRADHEQFWHSAEMRQALDDAAFTVGDDTLVVAQEFRLIQD